jgi:hypothetical protein
MDRLRYAVVDLLGAAPGSPAELDASADLARRIERMLANEPPGTLAGYDSYQLTYRLNDGVLTILSGPIPPDR